MMPGRGRLGEEFSLAKQFGLYPNQITNSKRQLVEHATCAFGGGHEQVEPLHAKIGQLVLENDFLAWPCGQPAPASYEHYFNPRTAQRLSCFRENHGVLLN